jgi:hypothetical protein
MKYFNKKGLARYQGADGTTNWRGLWGDYKKHLASIREHLSPSWQQLAEADFHDHTILSVHQPAKREFVMDLEQAKLTFTGVRFLWVPKSVVGDCWVYWEVSPSDEGGIDLEVSLAHDEIRIVADEVSIETHRAKTAA